jgi:hypothetical protein
MRRQRRQKLEDGWRAIWESISEAIPGAAEMIGNDVCRGVASRFVELPAVVGCGASTSVNIGNRNIILREIL